MSKRRSRLAAFLGLVTGIASLAAVDRAAAEDINVVLALPSPTLTFSAAFIAEDAGFFKKETEQVG